MQTQALRQNQAARLDEQVQARENHHRFRLQNCLPSESGAGLEPRVGSTPPCVAAPPPTPDRFSEWLVIAHSRVVLPVKHQNYVEGLCPTAGRPALMLFDSVGVGHV